MGGVGISWRRVTLPGTQTLRGTTMRTLAAAIICTLAMCAAAHADVVTVTAGSREMSWWYQAANYGNGDGGGDSRPVEQNLSATDDWGVDYYPNMYSLATYLFTHTATESNFNAQLSQSGCSLGFDINTILDVTVYTAETVNYEFTGTYASVHWYPGGSKELRGYLWRGTGPSAERLYYEHDWPSDGSTANLDGASDYYVEGSRTGVLAPGTYRFVLWVAVHSYTNDDPTNISTANIASGFANVRFWVEPPVGVEATTWAGLKDLYR
jgi:hypothetical protein